MIAESAQEKASLYVLGLLDAGEAAAFERELDADAELRALAKDLREAVAELARAGDAGAPSGVKARVLAQDTAPRPGPDKVVPGPWKTWVPWTLAAAFALCCGTLEWSREMWRQKYNALDHTVADTQADLQRLKMATPMPEDALRQVTFCPLEPTPQASPPPRAAVLWDASRREGKLRWQQLPPPGAGHDYQLWVVEAGRKETVNAGVVTISAGQTGEVTFKPVPEGGKEPVVAFALSLERVGGSPTNQGPVLFLGKL